MHLSETAPLAEIKTAYRNRARLCHPDKVRGPGAAERFVRLNQTYETLVQLKSEVECMPTLLTGASTAYPSRCCTTAKWLTDGMAWLRVCVAVGECGCGRLMWGVGG